MTTVKQPITSFTGEYRWLSNFYYAPFEYMDGIVWTTVEHAYQAAKTNNPKDRDAIQQAATPGQAKRLGRWVELRPDWESRKLIVMEQLITLKFLTHNDLKRKLLATSGQYLEEGNYWNDRYWGTVNGVGENHLGKLLMKLRDSLEVMEERWPYATGGPT